MGSHNLGTNVRPHDKALIACINNQKYLFKTTLLLKVESIADLAILLLGVLISVNFKSRFKRQSLVPGDRE